MFPGRVKSEEHEEDSKLHILQGAEEEDSEDDSSDGSVENEDTTNTTNENQTSSTSSIETEHLLGPRKTIPKNVLNLLEEWHKQHPAVSPECSYRNKMPKSPSKVFDRSGKELFLSMFLIKKPVKYTIIFVHDVHGPGKLVACLAHSPSRSYLLGWNGVEKGYDMEVSAVRMFARTLDEISFSPQAFDKAPAQPRPFRSAVSLQYAVPAKTSSKTTTTTSITTPNSASSNRPKPRPRGSGSSQNLRAAAQPDSESEYESESEAATSDASSSESDSNNNEKPATRPAKRLKKSSPVSPPQPQTKTQPPPQPPAKPHQVAFKLISEISDATRCFPISECTSGKDLFGKAKKFYQLLDDELEVTVLSCRIPSKHERRYLFRGSEGEFNMMLHDVNGGLQGVGGGETLIVEVRCMD